jgi:hypothetical protein
MRFLTDAEGRIIAVLLGASPSSERDRLHRAGVPRSTYHAARRRAYEEGWVQDRYVPDPVRLGFPWATFVLLRPFADRIEALSKRWSEDPSNVLSWWSPQMALGVFLHGSAKDADRLVRGLDADRAASSVTTLTAHLTEPEVPVFFDYEGLWTHLALLPGTITYPNGLGGNFPGADGPSTAPSAHQAWALGELIRRPFTAGAEGRAAHLVGPFGLPFSQQKMLRDGWITHRVFLYPARLPPYQGRSADQIVLISGQLRNGARPEELFATLTRECRVFPFLYAVHGDRLLLGALGRTPGVPAPGGPGGGDPPRRAVMPTLQGALVGIDVTQDLATQVRTVVDMRFDRLVPPGA